MNLRPIKAITKKELIFIKRDPRALILFLFTPTILMFILAYALTADIKHVPLAVIDRSQSKTSREFIQKISLGEDLDIFGSYQSQSELEALFDKGNIKAALILAPDFEEQVKALRGFPVQVIIDGTEPTSGYFALDHIINRIQEFVDQIMVSQGFAARNGLSAFKSVDLRLRTWYNPELKSKVDMIPGLISMVLGLPGLSVALSLSREREHGTLEQMMATPVNKFSLLLAKILPYILSGIFNVVLTTLIAILWFQIPFHGNFLVYLLLSLTFYFAILNMGMLIGVFMKTQSAAMALSFLLIFFPGFFLTGIFFPIVAMPEMVRMEAIFLPGTHYAEIARNIFIIGSGLDVLGIYGIVLTGLGAIFTAAAGLTFRKKLG